MTIKQALLRLTPIIAVTAASAVWAGGTTATEPDQPSETRELVTSRAEETMPMPETIFDRHIEAIGGRDAIFAIERRYIRGVYRGAPFNGPVRMTLWQEAPNKTHMILADPFGLSYEIAFDGKTAWEKRPDGTVAVVEGNRGIEIKEMADFYGEANYKKRYAEIKTMGDTTLEGEPCWIIDATSQMDRKRSLLFQKESGLFVAERVLVTERDQQFIMQVLLSNYQDNDGVLWPTEQHQTIDKLEVEISILFKKLDNNHEEPHDFSMPPSADKPEPQAKPATATDGG